MLFTFFEDRKPNAIFVRAGPFAILRDLINQVLPVLVEKVPEWSVPVLESLEKLKSRTRAFWYYSTAEYEYCKL